MSFVRLQGISKSYGSSKGLTEVLTGVNLEVKRGEFVAIVGYSGAGKTTLMSIIAGLTQPDAGTVTLNGKPVKGPGPDRGMVFQNYSLLPWLTVYGNVRLAVDQVFPSWTEQQKHERVERYVAMVNLSHARDRRPSELSGGMRQRVAVARALAMDPEILLLDEPLSALDALTRSVLRSEIERIWLENQKTVIMVTNDVDEGILLADRIIPLTAPPRATLGTAIEIDLERPRDPKALNHDEQFKRLRNQVIDSLLRSAANSRRRASWPVPDAEPVMELGT
jgi:nitrate/nitrite transport system ATP-binding protein